MSQIHPILDPTKRIRLVYDPDGEAKQQRAWEGIWVWLLVLSVVFLMIGLFHLSLFFR
jgi:hypothetical protein